MTLSIYKLRRKDDWLDNKRRKAALPKIKKITCAHIYHKHVRDIWMGRHKACTSLLHGLCDILKIWNSYFVAAIHKNSLYFRLLVSSFLFHIDLTVGGIPYTAHGSQITTLPLFFWFLFIFCFHAYFSLGLPRMARASYRG